MLNYKRGFSLMELLMTLSVLGVLTSLALPPLGSTIATYEGKEALRLLNHYIALARNAAASDGRMVTLCPSDTGTSCGGSWSAGNLLFLDRNGDRKINQDDYILRVLLRTEFNGTIVWRAFGNRPYLQIDAKGFMRYQSGNFTYCPHSGDAKLAQQLVINSAGRGRFAIDKDNDGFKENSQGKPLSCD